MRKLVIILVFLEVCSVPAMSQERAKVDLFLGYQYTHYPATSANGWNVAVTGNLTHWFGVTADFSGVYNHGLHDYTYMFGPVFAVPGKHVTPFVHALLGGARFVNSNTSAAAIGGGLDAFINQRIAFRVLQADWLLFDQFKRNGRLSSGVVVRF
jgi:hypothetical protein